jgi:hypothetical protein
MADIRLSQRAFFYLLPNGSTIAGTAGLTGSFIFFRTAIRPDD